MGQIVHVCDKYVLEFNIALNGNKYQLIFGGGQHV